LGIFLTPARNNDFPKTYWSDMMSAALTEVTVSILEQLKQQLVNFNQQKDLAQNNFNQLVGAIFATELMIKKYQDEENKGLNQPVQGEHTNGDTINQDQEQAS
jgi:hypothetical protein